MSAFPAVGTFCWPELATPDLEAAQAFYAALFGWTPDPVPSSGGTYLIWRKEGLQVGGAWQIPTGMDAPTIPPHWLTYVKVADVEATAKTARDLGGTVVRRPYDVMDLGRAALIADPEGTTFMLWQDGTHRGFDFQGPHGALGWTELACRQPDAAKAFYGGLFGWSFKDSDMGGFTYTEWMAGGSPVGGMMPMEGPEWEGVPSHWMPYFTVESVDSAAGHATSLGGSVCVPPTDIQGVGRFAVLGDPGGAFLSILKLDPS